jgi:hypothetical protein
MFAFLPLAFYENSAIFLSFSKQLLLNEQKYVVGFRKNAILYTIYNAIVLYLLHQAFKLNDYLVN